MTNVLDVSLTEGGLRVRTLGVILFASLVARHALAADPPVCAACVGRVLPDPSYDHTQLFVGLGAGFCARIDSSVGAAAGCGEATFGVDLPHYPFERTRLTTEIAFGWTPTAQTGSSDGVFLSAGGAYVAWRMLYGFDWSQHFTMRGGVEIDLTRNYPGLHPALIGEMSGRATWLEVGVRVRPALEGVSVSGAQTSPTSIDTAFSLGVFVFGRAYL